MKGEVRDPQRVWLESLATLGVLGLAHLFRIGKELKAYLGDESLKPEQDLFFTVVTCGLYGLLYLPMKYGKLLEEAQKRADMPNPENHGPLFLLYNLLFFYGITKLQAELNALWGSAGGAPATF
ncbi:MAG TPA: hypothetical protein RMH85_30275 [Polyangiaceae bacterium LLY-WYZ-15_(1-7)]|nr:hypothetical protein [Polyangiaceae bacterium LLY-WYZ-15_(1-7)]HJL05455.1 hypothetical protein [Polyangiaceae bacterium LLY-WYZ-15_(1-7)]HJL12808.1 hypothetical protein [Polyangiaceae bacterium LLY-WYZ-15_(1-7)]HJL25072.1 hypothetical protein [Polyangiaceae bacterium LLY-WYZ-15_(1-7)]HJL31690.1 hypothetical protein [Polyangiaceae bacterium LLY-WYZ-15_(1-7)]